VEHAPVVVPNLLTVEHCMTVARDASVSSTTSYTAAVQADRLLLTVPAGEPDVVVCEQTLRCYHRRMILLATCEQIASVKSRIAYIMSKTIPQKCMTRKFGAVCMNLFAQSRDTERKVKQLLLCSLLGNYRHCSPDSRPIADARLRLYYLLDIHAEESAWFRSLFQQCGHVVAFAIRDYLVYAIEDNPSFVQHMNQMFDWQEFRTIVTNTMDRVRRYISFSVRISQTGARPAPFTESSSGAVSHVLCSDLHSIVNPAHDRLLTICYKRWNSNIASALTSAAKLLPLIPIAGPAASVAATAAVDAADSDDEDEDDEVVESQDANDVVVQDWQPFVSPVQYQAMKKLVLRLLPTKSNVLFRAACFFPCFGIPVRVSSMTCDVIRQIQNGDSDTKTQRRLLQDLRETDRHAYNLLHVTSQLIHEIENFTFLRTLPVHYFRHQIDAVQRRFGLPSGKLLDSALVFRYCKVCDRVYSLLCDFHSVYKNEYTWGLRDAVTDYTTLEVYCKSDKTNHRGRCRDQPLGKVPLLGNLLFFNGRTILLCPQEACGQPMVLDTHKSFYNERGPSCKTCTLKLQQTIPVSDAYNTKRQCINCFSQPSKPQNTFLYQHGVAVCRKHHASGLTAYMTEQTPVDKKQTEQLIIAYIKQKKEDRLEAKLPQMKRDLMRRKMANRSNRRR
jgi:hypothetical protein